MAKRTSSSALQKRFEKLRVAAYDSVAANNLNQKDSAKIETHLKNMREELCALEDRLYAKKKKRKLTQEEVMRSANLRRKMIIKKKAMSSKFATWLFNNNEL